MHALRFTAERTQAAYAAPARHSAGHGETSFNGVACRQGAGEWQIRI